MVKNENFSAACRAGITAMLGAGLRLTGALLLGAAIVVTSSCGRKAEQNAAVISGDAPPVVESALAQAAIRNDIAEIKSLLEGGADINTRDALGRTPLHMVAFYGNPRTTEFLIANGADIDARDRVGMTALHIAVISGGRQEVEALLEKKADIKARTDVGQTALHLAAATGQPKLSRFLIERGADPRDQDAEGKTPLDYAIQNKHPQTTALLQKYAPKN